MGETTISYTSANFAFGMMWGGEEAHELSVVKKEDVLLAVNKAYRDMIQHNMPGLGLKNIESACKGDLEKRKTKEEIFKTKDFEIEKVKTDLVTDVINVFISGTFDHKNLCTDFIKSFKEKIGTLNAFIESCGFSDKVDEKNITYGLAQKIVNMTFKYLYLFDDKDKYETIFKQCHMPLDRYILDYLQNSEDAEWTVDAIKSTDKWSKLEEVDYDRISGAIQTKCKEKSGDLQFPLFAEFYLWPKALAYAKQKENSKKQSK